MTAERSLRFPQPAWEPDRAGLGRQPVGVLAVSDTVRPSAQETVRKLRGLKIECVGMLSGDHEKSVRHVADEVGLTDAWSDQKPQDKLQVIRDFQAAGKTVIFVGDGINDAPALATANVGVAMGAAGTDVALETADVALMNDDISKIPFLVSLGRGTLSTIKWNIAFGLMFNAVAVVAGGWGLLSPIAGAIVHNIGSVLVVLSSARLAFLMREKLNSACAEPPCNDGAGSVEWSPGSSGMRENSSEGSSSL